MPTPPHGIQDVECMVVMEYQVSCTPQDIPLMLCTGYTLILYSHHVLHIDSILYALPPEAMPIPSMPPAVLNTMVHGIRPLMIHHRQPVSLLVVVLAGY